MFVYLDYRSTMEFSYNFSRDRERALSDLKLMLFCDRAEKQRLLYDKYRVGTKICRANGSSNPAQDIEVFCFSL